MLKVGRDFADARHLSELDSCGFVAPECSRVRRAQDNKKQNDGGQETRRDPFEGC